ncbi:MAG: type II toxin-antitoxin system VapC family toxin [Candidatus Thermoplasmatota archaeon]|jgi:predicted nucleic acid-binding protein|nr:type II toxin-antitoxin system VapC family toxin [Candidatus Thermoplasmatota archaeon]
MRIVLDSSVLAKLVIDEPGSDLVFSIVESAIEEETDLMVSELAFYEVGNVLWKHYRGKRNVPGLLSDLYSLGIARVPMNDDLSEATLECALNMDITFYDAVHIAIAKAREAYLITEDRELLRKYDNARDIRSAINDFKK